MSHIDEGLLHAYLDGETSGAERSGLEEHIAGCAECRARLDDARSLRDRSAGVLRGSGPVEVTPPPFDEVLARSRVLETRRRVFRMNRLTALGWAATIVIAVGVGWIARGTLGWGGGPSDEQSVALDSAAAVVAQQVTEPEAEVGAVGRALEQAPARHSETALREAQRRDQPTAALKSEAAPTGRIEAKLADEPAELEEARPKLAEADVAPEPVAGVVAPAAAPPTEQRARRAAAPVDTVTPLERERTAEDQRIAQVVAAEEAPAAAAYQVDLDALVVGGRGAWRVGDEDAAHAVLGGPVALLPDIAVVAYLIPVEEDRAAVQLVQRLESGDIVVLTQERVTEPADDLYRAGEGLVSRNEPAPGESVASVSVRRGGYLFSLRGALPLDTLVALLERLP